MHLKSVCALLLIRSAVIVSAYGVPNGPQKKGLNFRSISPKNDGPSRPLPANKASWLPEKAQGGKVMYRRGGNSKNKALKFKAPPSKPDGTSRHLPSNASWLPATLTTPKANSMMNPLQTRPTSSISSSPISSKRTLASNSCLFFTSTRMQSEVTEKKVAEKRFSFNLFSSITNSIENFNERNEDKSVTEQFQSMISQRKVNSRLNTLLKVASVFEDTICTEERMAAIRSEFDLEENSVAGGVKFDVQNDFEDRQKKAELDAIISNTDSMRFRLPSLRIFPFRKTVKKQGNSIAAASAPSVSASSNYLSSLSVGVTTKTFEKPIIATIRYLDVPPTNPSSEGFGLNTFGYLDTTL